MIAHPSARKWHTTGNVWDHFIIPIVVLFACLSVATPNITFTAATIFGIAALYVLEVRSMSCSTVDYALLAFLAATIISFIHSEYLNNSLHATQIVVEACLVYVVVRSSKEPYNTAVYQTVLMYGIATACYSLCLFSTEFIRWKKLGFSDLTFFRQNLSLSGFGFYSGDEYLRFIICAGIGIVSLVLPISIKFRSWLLSVFCTYLNILCLLLTFSRLCYVSMIILIFLCIAISRPRTLSVARRYVIIAICFFMYAVVYIGDLFRPVLTTLRFSHTTSQIRSLDGRYGLVLDGIRIFMAHFWLGVGIGNYGHAFNGIVRHHSQNYSGQPFNWAVLISAEEGAIGLMSAICLFVMPMICCVRLIILGDQRKGWAFAVLLTTISIVFFLFGQSGLFASRHLANLFAVWMALIASGSVQCSEA